METSELAVIKLFVVGILVNTWMMKGLSETDAVKAEVKESNAAAVVSFTATESFNVEPTAPRPSQVCNESRLQWEVEICGENFKRDMAHVDPQYWCNLTHFISEYHFFTLCTETKSLFVGCYWPNPLVEGYIIGIHKHFFFNCTLKLEGWVDPPDDTLIILIVIPVVLTLAMIALVVWCSKRSDILA